MVDGDSETLTEKILDKQMIKLFAFDDIICKSFVKY
jgi:hypothetical protein